MLKQPSKPEDRSQNYLLWIFSIIFLMQGGFNIVYPWYTMIKLNCKRADNNQGKCVVLEGFRAVHIREIPLHTLLKARKIQEFIPSRRGGDYRYGVSLETTEGNIDLPKYAYSEDATNLANKLNAFINDRNQKSLQFTQSDRLSGCMWGVGSFFIALCCAISAKNPSDSDRKL